MRPDGNALRPAWFIAAVLLGGLALRLAVATMGRNYDFASWSLVAEIAGRGGNVYAETARYNYGPVWLEVLRVLGRLSQGNETTLHLLVAGLLGLVDAGIFLILFRAFGRLAAVLFFLNPVSVIVSGYHCQIDNVAVLLGLVAVCLIGDSFDRPVDARKGLGLVVLSLSLMAKHVLFAFPLWLAVKQRGLGSRLAVLLVPPAVFALGFLPYWGDGRAGIVGNVFRYASRNQEYFSSLFVPGIVRSVLSGRAVWLAALLVFGLVYARRGARDSLVLYTAVLVATSPSIANQYLAIPLVFVAVHPGPFTLLYTVVATFHLLVDADGLHVGYGPGRDLQYGALVTLLVLAIVQVTWGEALTRGWKRLVRRIRSRPGPEPEDRGGGA